MNENDDHIMLRRWGLWKVLEKGTLLNGNEFKVKLLHIKPGKSISRQYHEHRDEYWTILQGRATCAMGEDENKPGQEYVTFNMFEGDTEVVPKKFVHKITNNEDYTLIILELQMGKECNEEDITRLEKIDGEG